uniref:Uncharacterized protein n=1 Tax=Romanomermis culicivorax TaxID=13658 RepID=A0A915J649_ROMCU
MIRPEQCLSAKQKGMAQGKQYQELTQPPSTVWFINTMRKVVKLTQDHQRQALLDGLKNHLVHVPIDIDPGMGYLDKDHWKLQLPWCSGQNHGNGVVVRRYVSPLSGVGKKVTTY